jgi:spore maturation protein CgeB
MVFDAGRQAGMRVNVFDRNHDRFSRHFEFRYPNDDHMVVHPGIPHRRTAEVYKQYALSLNVNSVTTSGTMYSRRLLEILACGGIAVTNPSRAVDRCFRDYCLVVDTLDEAVELFSRFKYGPSKTDLERAEAGAVYVRQHHTWAHRLEELCAVVNV